MLERGVASFKVAYEKTKSCEDLMINVLRFTR